MMTNFSIHTIDTAPDASRPLLEAAQKAYGFVPNLIGLLAEAPAAAEAALTLGRIFDKSSLTAVERQVAILAISRYNECDYCVGAHSAIATMQKVPADVIRAIRDDQPIEDERLEALRVFATTLVDKRGWLAEDDTSAFLDAGYSKAQILEVVLAASYKTLTTYANHLAETPLDDAFASQKWQPVGQRAA